MLRKLHKWHVRREIQRDYPRPIRCIRVLVALGSRGLSRRGQPRRRESCNLVLGRQNQGKRLGAIQHIIAKLGRQVCELQLDLIESFLLGAFQPHTTELSTPHLFIHNAFLSIRQLGIRIRIVLNGLECEINRLGLCYTGTERNHLGLDLLDCFTQIVGILNCLQMRHSAPYATKTVLDLFQRLNQIQQARALLVVQFALQ
mmetsp:Transcript_20104/g.34631  ORF Transcript_20104/g.34631 Transcript_20104/m.34631 type:complete len:201 (-) Transcript_20104:352-954(-)